MKGRRLLVILDVAVLLHQLEHALAVAFEPIEQVAAAAVGEIRQQLPIDLVGAHAPVPLDGTVKASPLHQLGDLVQQWLIVANRAVHEIERVDAEIPDEEFELIDQVLGRVEAHS